MKKPSITADSLSFLLLAGLLLATTKVELTAQEATGTAIETMPLAINLDAVNWGPPGGGNGFPVGVRTARQGSDPVTSPTTLCSPPTHTSICIGTRTMNLWW